MVGCTLGRGQLWKEAHIRSHVPKKFLILTFFYIFTTRTWKYSFNVLPKNSTDTRFHISKRNLWLINVWLLIDFNGMPSCLGLSYVQWFGNRIYCTFIFTLFVKLFLKVFLHTFLLNTNYLLTDLFVDFTKAFDSIHRGKMEQILLAYGLPKETVAAITIIYRNTKVEVRSPDGDTEYFDIVAGILQGDTLAPYLFIICLDYVLRTSIDKIRENGFEVTKKRSRRYPEKQLPTPTTPMT